ncbi:MAG: hypothetical protein JWR51_1198 [Devosia sp.]|uniref:hypothetical protein n=1 Tax=Devosia sp. TaxID=1871048 RepID=UPI00261988F8|nr:hypothetical protein [Devosia sp.]MDB5528095.1 hypothetical protein [Devosia sp.]
MNSRVFIIAAIAASIAMPAFAQNDVCRDQNGNVDQNLSQGWQQFQASADPQAMQQLTGVWYTEIPNQFSPGQVAQRYTTFEPSGLFTTQTRVCANGQMCSDYPGHGFWASQMQNGVLVTFSIFSDTQVTNYCSITQAQFNGPNMMRDQNGQVQQRVQ